jgi:pyruvate/2-oxoglutarate/acetoin dehydrogenase E1 component
MLDLHAPIERVTGYDVAFPYWRLEDVYLPSSERVAAAVRRTLEY